MGGPPVAEAYLQNDTKLRPQCLRCVTEHPSGRLPRPAEHGRKGPRDRVLLGCGPYQRTGLRARHAGTWRCPAGFVEPERSPLRPDPSIGPRPRRAALRASRPMRATPPGAGIMGIPPWWMANSVWPTRTIPV